MVAGSPAPADNRTPPPAPYRCECLLLCPLGAPETPVYLDVDVEAPGPREAVAAAVEAARGNPIARGLGCEAVSCLCWEDGHGGPCSTAVPDREEEVEAP